METTTRAELQPPRDTSLISGSEAELLNAKASDESNKDDAKPMSKGYWIGKKRSEETKRKISEKLKGRKLVEEHKNNMYHQGMKGKHHTQYSKEKMSLGHLGLSTWNKGKKLSKEHRNNLSKSSIENSKINPNYGMRGKCFSEESKRKMSKSHKGHLPPQTGKTFTEFYGCEKSDNIKNKISSTLKSKFKNGELKSPFIKLREQNKLILPIKDTKIEIKIQNFLNELEIDFFTHQYININHGYQCDILIPSINLVIECDGDYWHKYPIGTEIDHIRTKELIEKGFKMLRLWESEIKVMKVNQLKERLNKC